MKKMIIFVLLFLFIPQFSFPYEIAKTNKGKVVILFKNGSWRSLNSLIGKEKRKMIIAYLNELIEVQKKYYFLFTTDSDKIIFLLNKYGNDLSTILKKGKNLKNKYPELNILTAKNSPKEIKIYFIKLRKVSKKIGNLLRDKKFKKIKGFQQALKKLDKRLND